MSDWVSWTILIVLAVIPVYALGVVLAIRSDLFDFSKGSLTQSETTAIWSLVGSSLTAAVALTGALLTKSHNRRTLALQEDLEDRKLTAQLESEGRLKLDTVVSSLRLVNADSKGYSPKAVVAGALAALVHLEHPVIAMRTLSPAWDEGAIDSATAVWLIGEVYQSDSVAAQLEAAGLLERHVSTLCGAGPNDVYWPPVVRQKWSPHLPTLVRVTNLETLLALLVSNPKRWWDGRYAWVLMTLEQCVDSDPHAAIRRFAALALDILLTDFPDNGVLVYKEGLTKHIADVRRDARRYKDEGPSLHGQDEVLERLVAWRDDSETARIPPSPLSP